MALTVVIDTDVMVAALESATGASRALLLAVLDGDVRMACSPALLFEYEAVLTRPAVRARSGLSHQEVAEVLDEIASRCVPVAFDFRWRPVADDPDDDLVIETAVNAVADVIASFNIKDMHRGAARFGIPVSRPADLLRRIRG